jgi:hypothetical protein
VMSFSLFPLHSCFEIEKSRSIWIISLGSLARIFAVIL